MSAVLAPFGLKPLYHPSGIVRPKALDVASGYNTNLFQYTPVKIANGSTGLIAAGTDGPALGVFMGVEYTPSDGRRRYSNWWAAGQVATQIVAYYTDDPAITYEIQADGSVTEANMGNQADVNAEVGNTTTGFSTISLATAGLISGGAVKLLRIVGISSGPGPVAPGNSWGDAYTIVQVQISNHVFVAGVDAV
jgi:hypothetical protein